MRDKLLATVGYVCAVAVRFPTGTAIGNATLRRLTGGSGGVLSKSGLHWGGLTFDRSIDGKPSGTPVTESVPPSTDGSYTFSLFPVSIALLEVE